MDVLKTCFSIDFACFVVSLGANMKTVISHLKNLVFVLFLFYLLIYFYDIWTLAFLSVLFIFDKLRTLKGFVI